MTLTIHSCCLDANLLCFLLGSPQKKFHVEWTYWRYTKGNRKYCIPQAIVSLNRIIIILIPSNFDTLIQYRICCGSQSCVTFSLFCIFLVIWMQDIDPRVFFPFFLWIKEKVAEPWSLKFCPLLNWFITRIMVILLTDFGHRLLNGNKLSGSLPEELGYLPNLIRLQVDENQISGRIPKSFANLSRLRHL